MSNNAVYPTFHQQAYDHGISELSPDTQREGEDEESDLESGIPYWPIDPLFDTRGPGQDPHPPNTPAGSIDWETITAQTPEVISPSSPEALMGTAVFDTVSVTYPTYSDTYFGQDLPLSADEFVSQIMAPSALAHTVRQMINPETDDSLFRVSWGMECQSVSNMIYTSRSPSGPPSALLNHDGLTAWSGPGHTTPTSDHSDRRSFGLLFNHPEGAPSRRSVGTAPEDGEAALKSRPADGIPTAIPEFGTIAVPSLSLPVLPIGWLKIPQGRYTQRKGARPFSQLEEITFSVNNVRGFNMKHAFGQLFTGLDGRDDPVLKNANGTVSCRLLFPGYPTNFRFNQIAARNWKKEPAPITRSKLAYEIAKRVKQCLDAFAMVPIDPSVDARWTIGQGRMKLEKMHLVSVGWVSKGSIQPEIWVDDS